MIVTRHIVAPVALLLALLACTSLLHAGLAEAPRAFLAQEGVVLVAPPGEATLGRRSMDEHLAQAAMALPGAVAASPELFVLTTHEGRSLFVRGVDLVAFLRVDKAELAQGRMPHAPGEALAGQQLQRHLDLQPGERLLLASSTARTATPVTVVGTVRTEGPARDELLVDLATARQLAGLGDGQIHLLRVRSATPDAVAAYTEAGGAAFQFSAMRVDAPIAVAGAPAAVRGNLTNWGAEAGAKVVQVREGASVLAERVVTVGARTTVALEVPFLLPPGGTSRITVNPTFEVVVGPPELSFEELPPTLQAGATHALRVVDLDGRPVPDARVLLGGAQNLTGPDGRTALVPTQPGSFVAVAQAPDGRAAVQNVAVTASPASAAVGFHPVVDAIGAPTRAVGTREAATFQVRLRNLGDAPGELPLVVRLDGTVVHRASVQLLPGAAHAVAVEVGPVGAGAHVIEVDGWPQVTLAFKAYSGRNPDGERLLDALVVPASRTVVASADDGAGSEASKRLLGNVAAALTVLAAATAALAALAVLVVVWRHLFDRAADIGTLKALGASDEQVLDRIGAAATAWGFVAAVLGVAGGALLARGIASLGILRAFGHSVQPYESPRLLAFLVLFGTALVAFGARAIARRLLRLQAAELWGGARGGWGR